MIDNEINPSKVKRRKQICQYCGDKFYARRSDAKFCTASCRQKNHNDKKVGEAYIDAVILQLHADKEEDVIRKVALRNAVSENLLQIRDPDKNAKFQKLLSELRTLDGAREIIDQIFLYAGLNQIPGHIIRDLTHKTEQIVADLKEKNQIKHKSLADALTLLLELLELKLTEIELTRKKAIKIEIPEPLRTELIKKYAQVKKRLNYV